MGLLKNLVSTAVKDGVRSGVGNAVGNALGKALEQAVTPTAERLAEKGVKAIDTASAQMDKTVAETKVAAGEAKTALNEAGAAATQASAATGGFAGLESALAGLTSRAEKFATQMSAQVKICPSCGQGSPADKTFCPHCGAKLPEKTLGEEYTCTKCGAANTPGTKFCATCGAILPAAEAEVKAQQAKDEAVLAKFDTLLPQYPKWNVGGSEFNLEEDGESNGYPIYYFNLVGGQAILDAYIALLKEAGFTQHGDQYWKTVDGVCRTVSTVDAASDNTINIGFFVSTYDKKVEKKPENDPVVDLKGVAKGMFKKFLG